MELLPLMHPIKGQSLYRTRGTMGFRAGFVCQLIRSQGRESRWEHYADPESLHPECFIHANGRLQGPIADTHGRGHTTYDSGRVQATWQIVANRSLGQPRTCVEKSLLNSHCSLTSPRSTMSNAADDGGKVVQPSMTEVLDRVLWRTPPPF